MKPKRIKKKSEKDAFRSTAIWQRKAEEIKERDGYLCQICLRDLYGTKRKVNHIKLSVHHAIPLQIDYARRLDNDNLLTLCNLHHEMAESGEIPYELIKKIIDEQEKEYPPGSC